MYSALVVPRLFSGIVLLLAGAVLVTAIVKGTFSAADTDPYGYVSQADLIARGTLTIDQRFARSMPWPNPEWAFAPHGYVPSVDGRGIVPTYPVGLPALMALFQTLSRQRDAVYFVVPLLGALTILLVARLGERLHSQEVGLASAILLALSPSFLNQVTQPVSDVPATAWWLAALVLALRPSILSACLAGVAASLAIVTRPNLVLLAAVIGMLLLWQFVRATRDQTPDRRTALLKVLAFVTGVVPGCAVVAVVHTVLYGSPTSTGYGPLEGIYAWQNVVPNLQRYPRWLVQTQSPFIVLGFIAPLVMAPDRRHMREPAWMLVAFAAVVLISYFAYAPWGWDEWGYLRFLLPAYPAMIVLSVIALVDSAIMLGGAHRARPIVLAVIGAVSAFQIHEVYQRRVFEMEAIERRYVDVGTYLRSAIPEQSVVIASLHAGSVRYYANRLTLNFDRLPPRELDRAIRTLQRLGYRVFVGVEAGEEPSFRTRFAPHSDMGRLDWPPAHKKHEGIEVSIYDVEDRARYLAGQPISTHDIALKRPRVINQR